MLLFEGEPGIFFLFLISFFGLLIGGCLWGSGENADDAVKQYIGIGIFVVACTTSVGFVGVLIAKKVAKRRAKRRDLEHVLKLHEEMARDGSVGMETGDGHVGGVGSSMRSVAYDNPGASNLTDERPSSKRTRF